MAPYDDGVTRVIESCSAYVRQLVSDGSAIGQVVLGVSGFYNWLQLLEVSRDNLYINTSVGTPRATAYWQERVSQLDVLLQRYRANKR